MSRQVPAVVCYIFVPEIVVAMSLCGAARSTSVCESPRRFATLQAVCCPVCPQLAALQIARLAGVVLAFYAAP